MSAGRPTLEAGMDKETLARFEQSLIDVRDKRTPASVAAKAWGMSKRSIFRAIENRAEAYLAATRYEKADKFEDMPGAKEFLRTIDNRLNTNQSRYKLRTAVKNMWADPEVFNKKPFSMLTKDDFEKAAIWAKKKPSNTAFGFIVAIRAIIRLGGWGKHEWLSQVLPTAGLWAKEIHIPPELREEATWVTVIPKIFGAVAEMEKEGSLSADQREQFEFVVNTKRLQGARTGNRSSKSKTQDSADREVWGLRINAGKDSLVMAGGKIVEWYWFAKKNEVWRVSREESDFIAPGLAEYTEKYVQKRGLKDGDYLIAMNAQTARHILDVACKRSGLSHFILHDFRKMYFTGLILAGVPMEVAVDLGVGWKKLDVAKRFYLTMKANTKQWLPTIQQFLVNNGQKVESN